MKWKFSFLLFFLFLPFQEAWGLTLFDLLTRTRVYLRDTQTAPNRQRFSDAQLTRFLNDGQQEINFRTWAVVSSTRISLANGTTEYSLPDTSLLVLRVTVDHVAIPERTFSFLDESTSTWMVSTGTIQSYYVRVDSSIVANVTRESIGFVPLPERIFRADVYFLQRVSDLVGSTDEPFSGNNRMIAYHHVLAYYAAYRGYLAMGLFGEAIGYKTDYEMLVQQIESNTKTKLLFNPSFRGNFINQGGGVK